MSAVVIKVDGVDKSSEITVTGIEMSVVGPWSATLRQDCRHDADSIMSNNNLVEIIIDGTTRFYGWVRVNEPGGLAREGVEYTAYDRRWVLENCEYVKINGRLVHIYNEEGAHDPEAPGYGFQNYWSVGETLIDILEHAIGYPGAGSAIPEHHDNLNNDITNTYLSSSLINSYDSATILTLTEELDEFEVNTLRFGNALTALLQWQGDVFWYIDPSNAALVVHKLSASSAVNVRAGEVNHYIGESGKNYDVIESAIQLDLSETWTKIICQGRDQTQEIRPANLDTIKPAWPSTSAGSNNNWELEEAWDPADEVGWTQADYDAGLYIGTTKQWVYRLYRAKRQDSRKWRWGYVFNSPLAWTGKVFVMHSGTLQEARQGIVGTSAVIYTNTGMVCFKRPIDATYRGDDFYWWGRREFPFTVSVGPAGASAYTDYSLDTDLAFYNEAWKHSSSDWPYDATYDYGYTVFNDTSKMTAFANKMQNFYGKERMAIEVVINGLDKLDRYSLQNKINFANLAGSKWASINLQIAMIRVDPEADTLTLSACNRLDGVTRDGEWIARHAELQWKRNRERDQFKRLVDVLRGLGAIRGTLPPIS